MSTKEQNAYEEWYHSISSAPKESPVIGEYLNSMGVKQPDFQRFILDHGFIVCRIPYLTALGSDVDGVEVGIVARVYGTAEDTATGAEGLEVIDLPIPTPHGRYILTFPKGAGAGTNDWLIAVANIDWYFRDCVLPLSMAEYCDLIVCQGGSGKFKLVVRTCPCAKCGKETPDRRQHYVEMAQERGYPDPSALVSICDDCGGDMWEWGVQP